MIDNPTLKEVRRLAKEVIDNAAKAGLMGGEWEQVSTAVQNCAMYARMTEQHYYTEKSLAVLLKQVKRHHRFIMDTVNRKRRPHPERSRRRFL